MPRTILTIIVLIFSLLFSGVFANSVFAAATSCIGGTAGKTLEGNPLLPTDQFGTEWADCFGLEKAIEVNSDIKSLRSSQSFPLPIVVEILGLALSFLGIIFFLIIIVAGIVWMTAMGSSEKAEKAKDMLEAAVVGLIIVLGAYAITKFVFKSFGADKAPEFVGQSTSDKSCATSTEGADCGGTESDGKPRINMVCNKGKQCVSKCKKDWPNTGECYDLSGGKSCPTGLTKVDNKCPSPGGNSDYKCCHGND